jgi:hypothetical protein
VTAASALGTLDVGTLGLLVRLRLAGELDRDLALKDLLAGELSDGTLSLGGGREVDEGVADRAVGARVLRDGNRLTAAWMVSDGQKGQGGDIKKKGGVLYVWAAGPRPLQGRGHAGVEDAGGSKGPPKKQR